MRQCISYIRIDFKQAYESFRKVLYYIISVFVISMSPIRITQMRIIKPLALSGWVIIFLTHSVKHSFSERGPLSPFSFNCALQYAISRVQDNQEDRLEIVRYIISFWFMLMMLIYWVEANHRTFISRW
jgi:hypothetical protein